MITRLYAHNYLCLLNFTVEFGDLNVVIGSNGTGKTAAISALRKVRDVIHGAGDVQTVFPPFSQTRWLASNESEFKVSTNQPEGDFEYSLRILHARGQEKSTIVSETLHHEGNPIFEFVNGNVQLYRSDYSKSLEFPSIKERSALSIIPESQDNALLMSFKKTMASIVVVSPNPYGMVSLSQFEEPGINADLSNVASWMRSQIHDVEVAIDIQRLLSTLLDGFQSFNFQDLGQGRRFLMLRFTGPGDQAYALEELSEGQRIIVGLAALLEFARRNKAILVLDEPDNFVAPNVVASWFSELQERTWAGQEFQAIVISHHPHIMDQMSQDVGLYFSRVEGAHTTVSDVTGLGGDVVSEFMARGWMDDAPAD